MHNNLLHTKKNNTHNKKQIQTRTTRLHRPLKQRKIQIQTKRDTTKHPPPKTNKIHNHHRKQKQTKNPKIPPKIQRNIPHIQHHTTTPPIQKLRIMPHGNKNKSYLNKYN